MFVLVGDISNESAKIFCLKQFVKNIKALRLIKCDNIFRFAGVFIIAIKGQQYLRRLHHLNLLYV